MSSKHLTVGSVDPPRTEGLLRLYSMKFCPYAQRAMLVLKAKKIPHEIVYINLFKKPEWYSKINAKTLVPALADGDKIVTESLDIADYLDEKYPENPLYSSDPNAKQKAKEIIDKLGPASKLFYTCILKDEGKTPEEWAKSFLEVLQPLEDELAKCGTPFFGGDKPGMVDYMIWPWAERSSCIAIKLGQKLPFGDGDIPLLRKWRKNMMNDPTCSELYISGERFWKIAQCKITGTEPPYDEV
ncbi:pyrimidodiazepine synthase-like [Diorhabda sublineata]|uniref:pyrimidodiazepine synthase-like n=1 Tax=Diorhabda sublineata TaxID=1163346 RepID=UPI0024E0B023|nr:pyrimidodiazepine synthase-like [Diorhabda sublineata]XP_056641716.1 pyrimidodiazepine synthase-like [Diorhabda sublineata]